MDGILLLRKPKGLTSHDCVFKIRKILRTKKVGHTGTLDPDVTGVLPICVGKATKIVEYLTGADKTYEGEVTIGFSTTTEDASGEVVDKVKVERKIMKDEIEQVLHSLTGEQQQTPPMYSAVKVNGKKLYEYARKGIEVERPSRKITIHSLSLLDAKDVYQGETISFSFRVKCSKGTYVRTLAVMMGEKLGYPAHMSYLTRTNSGQFSIDQCLSFDEVEALAENGQIEQALRSVEAGLSNLPNYKIHDKLANKVQNGAVLSIPPELYHIEQDQPFTILDHHGKCLAIYKRHPTKEDLIKPVKVFQN